MSLSRRDNVDPVYNSRLCNVCRQIQIPHNVLDPSLRPTPQSHHLTLKGFLEAVEHDCYVCVSLHKELAVSHPKDIEMGRWLAIVWVPAQFWVTKDSFGRQFYKLVITIADPWSPERLPQTVHFRLISYGKGELHPLQDIRQLGDRTSCASSLQTIIGWFSSCHREHNQCGRYSSDVEQWQPTRLIDIGPEDSMTWHLVDTGNISRDSLASPSSKQEYIALSYKWGPAPQLRLLSSSMEDFRQGKLIQDLPGTFRDLALLARKLSIRFLWIDALCIIQDSTTDWDIESLTMRRVYTSASLTVAASASADEDGGLFRSRDPASILPAIVTLSLSASSSSVERFYVFERDYWSRNISTGPLHNRGWVFQERHLSPRVLYFGASQVLWECFQEGKCEGFPQGIPFYCSDKNLSTLWNLVGKSTESNSSSSSKLYSNTTTSLINVSSASDSVSASMSMPVYSIWRDLVRDYSRCSLTKPEDKLPAFAGITHLFQEITGDDYLAGLWRSRILEGIDWRVMDPVSKSSCKYRAPSWSWASVDAPVYPKLPSAVFQNLVRLVEVEVQPEGSNINTGGRVSAGHLVLDGVLIQAKIRHKLSEEPGEDNSYIVALRSTTTTSCSWPSASSCCFGVSCFQVLLRKPQRWRWREFELSLRLDHLEDTLRFDEHHQNLHFVPINSDQIMIHQGEWASDIMFLILAPFYDRGTGQLLHHSRIRHFVLMEREIQEDLGFRAREEDGLMVLSSDQKMTRITIV